MSKPYATASAVLLAAAFVTAAALDASHVINQVLLPLLAAFSVSTTRQGACFKRGEPS